MITRKIGKLIRGSATPFQIVAACLLGSLLAFLPGFKQAPGLFLTWLAILVILNANLFVAGIVGVAAKLVALLIAPVSFAIGRFLLEGPLRGLFEAIVNAPVLAWFGFEYPLVTGGQAMALIFGLVTGVLLVRAARSTWRRLAALESDSAAYQKWMSKRWVKIASFLFVGGLKGKKSYEQLLARRFGNPVRVVGLVLVVALGVLGYIGAKFFDDAIVTSMIRSGLESANGATVDLERASLDPTAGSLTLTNLALCDPDHLATNLFAAKSVEAKLSTSDLLRKRATVDLVTVVGATQGDKRAVPGKRLSPEPEANEDKWKLPNTQSLGDLLKNAQVWRERLATLRRWIEKFSGSPKEAQPPPGETGPSYEDVLRERIRVAGYANYQDVGLIQKAPRLLIRKIEADEVQSASLPDEKLALVAENISTQPGLVDQPPRVSIHSASGTLAASLALDPTAGAAMQAQLEFLWKGLPVDDLASQVKTESEKPPVSGGTADVSTKGVLSFVDSNLPLVLTLHHTNVQLGGGEPKAVAELTLPTIVVRGPIDHPSLQIPQDAFQKVFSNLVKGELRNRAEEEIQKRTGADAKGLLDLLKGKKSKDDEKQTPPPPQP